jgi:hypothetical protein
MPTAETHAILNRRCSVKGTIRTMALLLLAVVSIPRISSALGTGFIQNQGQVDAKVGYYAPGAAAVVYFTSDAVVLDLKEDVGGQVVAAGRVHRLGSAAGDSGLSAPTQIHGCAVHIRFADANPHPVIEGRRELPTRYNYILGNDPSTWRSGVSAYSEVVYHDLWPGIDLTYREEAGQLAYELTCRPGADPGAARFTYEGAEQVVPEDGSTLIRTRAGTIVDIRPASGGSGRLALAPEAQGSDSGLRDDPSSLVWSTFLGGNYDDQIYGEIADANGVVVTGVTMSYDFPTTPGAYQPHNAGGWDVTVSRLSPDGSNLVWSTHVGGTGNDAGLAIATDSQGNNIVTGQTSSSDFPTTAGAFDRTANDGWDAFALCLDPTGSALLWSTYLGGMSDDYGTTVIIDTMDNPLIGGESQSSNYPVTPGAYDATANGNTDIVLTKLSSSGSTLLWSTYLGGAADDLLDLNGRAMALDSEGNLVLVGWTYSDGFPTTPGAYDRRMGGASDACVAKISATGSALVWSTFLGGDAEGETGWGLALDPTGDVFVTGRTWANDFPTTPGAFDRTFYGPSDAFVSRISANGSALVWSTLLGGEMADCGWSLCPDDAGDLIVMGATRSAEFPTTPDGYDRSYNGDLDTFVCKLDSSGSTLLHGTYLGGGFSDDPYGACLDPLGRVVVCGITNSPDYPTTPGAIDLNLNDSGWFGNQDGFVSVLELRDPAGVPDSPDARSIELRSVSANPFAGATTISYRLNHDAEVRLNVLDMAGRRVATLLSGWKAAGAHQVSWDGRDAGGSPVGSGVYLVRMETDGGSRVVKVARIR